MIEYKTIRELCSIVVDCPHSTPKWTEDGKIVVRNNNIKNGRINLTAPSFTDDEHFRQRIKRAKPQSGDLIITREAPIGEVGMIPANIECCLGQRMVLLRVDQSICDNFYLLYSLQSPYVKNQISWSEGTGTTVSNLRIPHLENIKIPYIPLELQKRVSSVLRVIEEKIFNNSKINENLLQQALAIYKAWFCDYVLSDGVLPENWHITTIDALSSLVTRGIAPKYDDNNTQIVLNQKCIRDHTIDVSLARRHLPKKINEKWISKGDLLINSTGTGTLGRVAQVWFDANNMTVDSHITIVRPKAAILQSYIGFWGLSHESEIEAQHTGSTGQTELPRDRVKAMELTLPDEDTLSKFNELVIPMTDAVVSNQKENARLSQLRDTLLPKLMSGKIDVSELEL